MRIDMLDAYPLPLSPNLSLNSVLNGAILNVFANTDKTGASCHTLTPVNISEDKFIFENH